MNESKSNKKLTEKQLLKYGLEALGEGLCFFYEMETYAGKQMAVMLDSVIKCATAQLYQRDPRIDEEDYHPFSNVLKESD